MRPITAPQRPRRRSSPVAKSEVERRNATRKSVLNSVHANKEVRWVHIGAVWRSHNSFSFDASPHFEHSMPPTFQARMPRAKPEPPPLRETQKRFFDPPQFH